MIMTIPTEIPHARGTLPVQRRLTLEVLARFGPLAMEAIPRAWPLTREDVAGLLRELEGRGAVAFVADTKVPGRRLARMTEAGTRLLRELDDAAMRTLVAAAEAAAPGYATLA